MNIKPIAYCTLLALALAGGAPAPGQNTPPGPADYDRFSRFVAERNIFNPEREPRISGHVVHHHDSSTRHRAAPAFAFVGAMEYGKGTFAFFDGNNDDSRKSRQVKGRIAGYTVQEISLGGVKLATGSNSVFLAVGAQMRQTSDGSWELADEPQDLSNPPDNAGAAPAAEGSSSAATPAAPTGEMSDVLKRLMKLREQENK